MSVAQSRAAGRKMRLRYGRAHFRSIGDSIAAERRKAARSTNIVKKAKT